MTMKADGLFPFPFPFSSETGIRMGSEFPRQRFVTPGRESAVDVRNAIDL